MCGMDTPQDADIPEDERQALFLENIRLTGCTDRDAAEWAGVSRWTAQRWKHDPVFKSRYNDARKIGIEELVREAERRAMNNSDRMLMFLLCNYAPERFSNKQTVEHQGAASLTVLTGVPNANDISDLI